MQIIIQNVSIIKIIINNPSYSKCFLIQFHGKQTNQLHLYRHRIIISYPRQPKIKVPTNMEIRKEDKSNIILR